MPEALVMCLITQQIITCNSGLVLYAGFGTRRPVFTCLSFDFLSSKMENLFSFPPTSFLPILTFFLQHIFIELLLFFKFCPKNSGEKNNSSLPLKKLLL